MCQLFAFGVEREIKTKRSVSSTSTKKEKPVSSALFHNAYKHCFNRPFNECISICNKSSQGKKKKTCCRTQFSPRMPGRHWPANHLIPASWETTSRLIIDAPFITNTSPAMTLSVLWCKRIKDFTSQTDATCRYCNYGNWQLSKRHNLSMGLGRKGWGCDYTASCFSLSWSQYDPAL